MASERLTDDDIHGVYDNAMWHKRRNLSVELPAETVEQMAIELRERRAADLTAEDIRVLRFLVVMLRESPEVYALVGQHPNVIAGVAVLDRLTKEQG